MFRWQDAANFDFLENKELKMLATEVTVVTDEWDFRYFTCGQELLEGRPVFLNSNIWIIHIKTMELSVFKVVRGIPIMLFMGYCAVMGIKRA